MIEIRQHISTITQIRRRKKTKISKLNIAVPNKRIGRTTTKEKEI